MTQYIIRFNKKSDEGRKKYLVFEIDFGGREQVRGTRNLVGISALGRDHEFRIEKSTFVNVDALDSLVDFLDRRHKRYSFC